jgi:uncharacterized lipoprotein YmbA
MRFHLIHLGFVVFATGCAITGESPPTQFYILSSTAAATQVSAIQETIGLAPISLPRYLDRPQIVTVEPGGRVTLAEFHRWAEPLAAGFSRVLAEGLSARLPGKAVVVLPAPLPVTRTVEIQVQDFRTDSDRCVLTVTWRLRRGNETLSWQRQTIEQPLPDRSYSAVVSAMGKTIDGLAERIAEKLR